MQPIRTPLPKSGTFSVDELTEEVGNPQTVTSSKQAIMAAAVTLSNINSGLDQSDREDAIEGLVQVLEYLAAQTDDDWEIEYGRFQTSINRV